MSTVILKILLLFFIFYSNATAKQIKKNFPADLHAMITNYVAKKLNLKSDNLLIEISPKSRAPIFHLQPNVDLRWQILPGRKTIHRGSQIIRLGLFNHKNLIKTIPVFIKIRTFEEVVLSNTAIPQKQIISESLIRKQTIETTNLRYKYFTHIKDVVGKISKRYIQPNEVITGNMIEEQPLITTGKRINIHCIKGNLEIILPGIARENGKKGDFIRVKTLDTQKILKAKVINAQNVLINF